MKISYEKIKRLLMGALLVPTLLTGEVIANNESSEIDIIPPLSVQLWSVKNTLKSDFDNTIKALADMGFDGVEFANEFGPYKNNPAALQTLLTKNNIKASSAHISFDELNDENFDKTVTFYQTLEVDMLIVGWDERAWHPEGIKVVVKLLNDLSVKLAPLGMQIGFHNHDHEFDAFDNDTYWDYMAKHTPNNVILQQDVGWTTYTGKDPIEYVKRYPNRTLTTHFKVKLPVGVQAADPSKQPFIGQDTIDWPNLIKANITFGGSRWLVVEQEEYPNGLTELAALSISKQGLDKIIKNL